MMACAVILAGGRSQRSGRVHKALRQIRHQGSSCSWLQYQTKQLQAAGFQRIILATGFRSRRLLGQTTALIQKHNPDPKRGPFSSLQQALSGFSSGPTLLQPLDNPVPSAGMLFRIRLALRGKQVSKPCFDGRGGHPLLLAPEIRDQIRSLDPEGPDARLDKQLRKLNPNQISRVEVNQPQVLSNLNTPAQWQRFLRCS